MSIPENAVCIVTSEFPPEPGGIGNHAYLLARSFKEKGLDVDVLTNSRETKAESRFIDQIKEDGFKVHFVPRSSFSLITYIKRITSFIGRTKKSRPGDVFIFSGKFSIWLSILSSRKFNNVAVIHGSEIRQKGFKKWLFNKGLRRMDRVISVSGFTQDRLRQEYQLDDDQLNVINNGFDQDKFNGSPKESAPGELHLITTGNMHPRKGQQNVIRAIPMLRDKGIDVKYHVVGIPTTKEKLMALGKELNVAENLVFHDKLSDTDLLSVLKEAHIFLMLSEEQNNGDFEGFGIALIEANAMGLPSIGSRNSGIADAIDHGQSGLLVDPHDPSEVASAISDITKNYQSYSSQALAHAKKFQWDKVIDQYLQELSLIQNN